MKTKNSLLVVDNDSCFRTILSSVLEYEGYNVFDSCCENTGYETIRQHNPGLVICNISAPGNCAATLYKKVGLEKNLQNIPFLFMSAGYTSADINKMMGTKDLRCLQKPFTIIEMLNLLNELLPVI